MSGPEPLLGSGSDILHEPEPEVRTRTSRSFLGGDLSENGPPGQSRSGLHHQRRVAKSSRTPRSKFQCSKPEVRRSRLPAASPLGFRLIPAPRQSTPLLTFLAARSPFTILSCQDHRPNAFRVWPAKPEIYIHSTPPTTFVSHFQPVPTDLSNPPLSKVIDPGPNKSSEASERVPDREGAPQMTQNQAARPGARIKKARAHGLCKSSLCIAGQHGAGFIDL